MALQVCTGFEFGTTAGWATGNAGNKIIDSVAGSPTIITTNPRTGDRALEISTSAATENVMWDTNTLTTNQNRVAMGFAIYCPTTVPTAQIIAQDSIAAGTGWVVSINSSDQITAGWEGGSTGTGPTLSADTWYYVEVYADHSANPHTFRWWVDTEEQSAPSNLAQAASTISNVRLGTTNTETFTMRYDDLVVYTATAAITVPIGKHKVELLSVDPSGTVTLSGTEANFSTFTSNGTLAAWNATTARNNIDEVPPTIGASADGWVQDTTATSDYVEMPMTTYTLGGGETIARGRMLAPGWATSGTAATIGFRSWNGSVERTLFATADPNFDNSTTAPGWVCKMLGAGDFTNQTELDALAFRVGFSGDAAPDIGIHAIYAEVAIIESTGPEVLPPPPTILQQAVNRSYTY